MPTKHYVKKEDRVGYVYETRNLINGKLYIGMHATAGFDTKYLGSGKHLRRAIRKYGRKQFSTRILKWASSIDTLCDFEIALIAKRNAVLSDRYYNISPGGEGRAGGRLSEEHISNMRKGSFKGGSDSRPCKITAPYFVINARTQLFGVTYNTKNNAFYARLLLATELSEASVTGLKNTVAERGFAVKKFGYAEALLLATKEQDALYDKYFPATKTRNLNADGSFSAELLSARANRRWYGVIDMRNRTEKRPSHDVRPYCGLLYYTVGKTRFITSCGTFATPEEAAYSRDKKVLEVFGDEPERIKKFKFNFEELRNNPDLELHELI